MKYKLLASVLVLALVVSLGFDYYYIRLQAQDAADLNNVKSRTVRAWAREMFVTGLLIENATTNFHVARVFELTESAWRTGEILFDVVDYSNYSDNLYWQMIDTPYQMGDNLFHYAVGSPTDLKYINSSAFPMFRNLASMIYNMTGIIIAAEIDEYSGIDPTQQLVKDGVLSDIIRYCIDIKNLSKQLADLNPKFQ